MGRQDEHPLRAGVAWRWRHWQKTQLPQCQNHWPTPHLRVSAHAWGRDDGRSDPATGERDGTTLAVTQPWAGEAGECHHPRHRQALDPGTNSTQTQVSARYRQPLGCIMWLFLAARFLDERRGQPWLHHNQEHQGKTFPAPLGSCKSTPAPRPRTSHVLCCPPNAAGGVHKRRAAKNPEEELGWHWAGSGDPRGQGMPESKGTIHFFSSMRKPKQGGGHRARAKSVCSHWSKENRELRLQSVLLRHRTSRAQHSPPDTGAGLAPAEQPRAQCDGRHRGLLPERRHSAPALSSRAGLAEEPPCAYGCGWTAQLGEPSPQLSRGEQRPCTPCNAALGRSAIPAVVAAKPTL